MIEIPVGLCIDKFPNYGVDVCWPVHLEKKISTMDKKLIITVAPVGALISKKQNPNQPSNAKEIAEQVIGAYKEGASVFHVHCRVDGAFAFDYNEYRKTMDLVFEKAPDMLTSICTVSSFTHEGAEKRIKPAIDPLLEFGKKYCEIAVINPITCSIGGGVFIATPSGIEEETAYMEKRGVKPELAGYNLPAMEVIQQHLIDTGISKKPYLYDLVAGVHNCTPVTPDPEGFVNLVQMLRVLPPGSNWQAIIGGRNWLPLTVFAIMLGADIVRVGMEDQVHIYPHKDDMIQSSAQVVKKIATIVKELGREIATPSEAREILGLESR